MSDYYYLVSSLPMLDFHSSVSLEWESFTALCRGQLTSHDFDVILRVSLLPKGETKAPYVLGEWNRFEVTLRNELAKKRTGHLSGDPSEHIRGEENQDPFIESFAQWAVSQDSPLEVERALDAKRWEKIEELEMGHYFDIEFLTAYALKLLILERWKKINEIKGREALENVIKA